jgi:hypothetical protein
MSHPQWIVQTWMYRAIGLVLDFIHRLVCGRHTRRWIKSKTSPIALYNINHRQNPFKSNQTWMSVIVLKTLRVECDCVQYTQQYM